VSTLPDDQLLDLAAQGKLKDPRAEQQVKRMLPTRRPTRCVEFRRQWLYLRNIQSVSPNEDDFPLRR